MDPLLLPVDVILLRLGQLLHLVQLELKDKLQLLQFLVLPLQPRDGPVLWREFKTKRFVLSTVFVFDI